jgi:hypothetical protein
VRCTPTDQMSEEERLSFANLFNHLHTDSKLHNPIKGNSSLVFGNMWGCCKILVSTSPHRIFITARVANTFQLSGQLSTSTPRSFPSSFLQHLTLCYNPLHKAHNMVDYEGPFDLQRISKSIGLPTILPCKSNTFPTSTPAFTSCLLVELVLFAKFVFLCLVSLRVCVTGGHI